MGSESPVPQKVVDYVTRHDAISVEEIMQDLNVSRTTAKNYLSRLAKMDVIKRIGKGLYQVGKGTTATVRLSDELSSIAQYIKKRFPMSKFVIWSINMLADYAHYAIGRDLIVLETDRILSPSIRDALIERRYHAILNPENRDFREYAYYNEKTIFILERSEKYGLFENQDVYTPTPERIWLDIYYLITRKELSFLPGELGLIFANMLRKEGVNFNRLLRYAQRRNLRDEIIIFLYRLKQSWQLSIPDTILVGKKEALKTINEMVEGARE
jgi:DNA-binding Lrp family transcriptional regulator